MKKAIAVLGCVVILQFFFALSVNAQQTDASDYFPLGLWGVWIDTSVPPRVPGTVDWGRETSNFVDINANYLTFWIPNWVEDQVLQIADQHNYRLDLMNSPGTSSGPIMDWILDSSLADSATAIARIETIRSIGSSHPSFYSYTLGHEHPVDVQSSWPNVEFVAKKVHELDPGKKTYLPVAGIPDVAFYDATPSLDVIQVECYLFEAGKPAKHSFQQSILDNYVWCYNLLMNRFRGRYTEWHAIIQTEHDYRDPACNTNLRRPNVYELRAQAYLALSRGARGITSFVYGSDVSGMPTLQLSSAAYGQNPQSNCAAVLGYAGLVQPNRLPYNNVIDPDHEAIFDNLSTLYSELRLVGPTLRKLRVYDAFSNSAVPSNNAAGIASVSGDLIEIGVFKRFDQGADSTPHFMLVNRVCNDENGIPCSPQNITVTFNNSSTPLAVVEIASGTSTYVPTSGSFTDILNPGSGKLYKVGSAPATPPNLPMTNTSPSPIHLAWDASSGPNLAGYEVSRYVAAYPAVWTVIASPTTNSYTDNQYIWAPGGGDFTASYKVRARNTSGFLSDYSNTTSEMAEENGKAAKRADLRLVETHYENSLNQNSPNPFNPTTRISFSLAEESSVTLEIFDALGKKIQTLADGDFSKGPHDIQFDGSRLASGFYVYRIQAVAKNTGIPFTEVRKMVLAK